MHLLIQIKATFPKTNTKKKLISSSSTKRGVLRIIELLVVLALLGIAFLISTIYSTKSHETSLFQSERDKIVKTLKIAQQKSISVEGGYAWRVHFGREYFELIGGVLVKRTELHPDIIISNAPLDITFKKLTGLTDPPGSTLNLTLESNHLKCYVYVSKNGVFSFTGPEKR